ncbi:MAG: MSHA pilin protein MshA [Candidatus Azotimanducaceae bacterium]|jgi:MSHA pilin protein MshA
MKNIKNEQSGFTLVELVIAVALVGVLSTVAIPKIIGVSDDARQAALNGVAAALTASSTCNYAIRGANNANVVAVLTCAAALATLEGGAFPAGFEFDSDSGDGDVLVAADTAVDCTISTTTTPVLTVDFKAYGIA